MLFQNKSTNSKYFEPIVDLQPVTAINGPPNAQAAVKLEGAYKSYGKHHVLRNLNMTVPHGAIYGLLGPSGCGKTTILRSIVSRVKLDDGLVSVFGHEPGTRASGVPGPVIGYMPQEIALYNEFDIDETLNYFGYFHNMEKERLNKQKEFLLSFLDLTAHRKTLVKNLSGGQKRRVSMMCALLQEPKILILDEPTVGVDPLLREKIWDHLIEISKARHTTIIITTHYIEEARKADCVGLMRNGRILAEDSPDNLLQTYNQTTLENVFLDLCVKDSGNKFSESVIEGSIFDGQAKSFFEAHRRNLVSNIKLKTQNIFQLPKWHNLKGLVYKNGLILRRDLGFLAFEFFIPIIQISLFCLCIGREPYDLKMGVVNNETIYDAPTNYSTIYVNELSNYTFKKSYMNWSQAYSKVKQGELWGFFDISRNFSQDTVMKLYNSPSGDGYSGSFIKLHADATNQQISFIMQMKATEAYQSFLAIFLPIIEFPVNASFLQLPILFEPVYGEKNPQFIGYMAPGVMTSIVFSLAIGFTAVMFVVEKKEGLVERCSIAGVTTLEIMIAHVAVRFIVMTVQILGLMVMATTVFQVPIKGPFMISAVLLLLQGFCGMSFGLTVSSIADNEIQSIQMAIATIFPSLILSGIIWPVDAMAKWVQVLTNFSPLTHVAEAMRSVASRGWGLSYFNVWFGFVTVILWSIFFNAVAAVVFVIRQQ